MSQPCLRPLAILAAATLVLALGCQRSLSPEAQAAQEVAKSADARVAALEKELAELKAGKQDLPLDQETKAQLSKNAEKALERQLADAKKRADEKKKEAQTLAAQPAPKEAPKPVMLDVPKDTKFEVKLAKDLATDTVQAGDNWEGTLEAPVVVDGKTVWPTGTAVRGVVTQSVPAGRLSSGNGGLAIRLTSVGQYEVAADTHAVVSDGRLERNAKYIGGAAALGALVGVLSDKKNKGDHALGGAAVGAAVGTAVAAGTADTVIRIPMAKPITFTLAQPERVTLKP